MTLFTSSKQDFDRKYETQTEFDSFLSEHLTLGKKVTIKNKAGKKNEEYYKWQFLYSIVQSGLFAKDFIGTEIYLPKGNKSSAPLKLDAAVFDNADWFENYRKYHANNDTESLDWLRQHLLVAIEFKKEDSKDIETVWNKQLKAYLKESERAFCLGILYDTEKLYLGYFRNLKPPVLKFKKGE